MKHNDELRKEWGEIVNDTHYYNEDEEVVKYEYVLWLEDKINDMNQVKNNVVLDGVIERYFINLFDKADKIKHWHNTGENDEGTVVSTDGATDLVKTINKYRDFRCSL